MAAHPSSQLALVAGGCGDCQHSEHLNCVLKGAAFWWLLARLVGWVPGATGQPGEVAPGDTPATAQVWTDGQTLAWPEHAAATSYKVYRGAAADLPHLLDAQADSCLAYAGAGTSAAVSDGPPTEAEDFLWYLVTGVNGMGEGTPGDATAGMRTVNSRGSCGMFLRF